MNRKLHLVSFTVEAEKEKVQPDQGGGGGDRGDDDLGDDGEEDDLLDDTPANEQPPSTQGPSSSTSNLKTPISKPNSNSGYKTINMVELSLD